MAAEEELLKMGSCSSCHRSQIASSSDDKECSITVDCSSGNGVIISQPTDSYKIPEDKGNAPPPQSEEAGSSLASTTPLVTSEQSPDGGREGYGSNETHHNDGITTTQPPSIDNRAPCETNTDHVDRTTISYPPPSPLLGRNTVPSLPSEVTSTSTSLPPSQESVKNHKPRPSKPYCSYDSLENVRYSTTEPPYPDHYNEDRVLVLNNLPPDNNISVYGVFDGHDGSKASSLAEQYLGHRFKSWDVHENLRDMNPADVLTGLFLEAESQFFKEIAPLIYEKEDIQSRLPKNITSYQAYMLYPEDVRRLQEIEPEIAGGSTAVVSVIVDGRLYVANVGDSRAVLVHRVNNELVPEQLSTDHGVDNEEELMRLQKLGLDVSELKRNGRLGTQENTRSIGDYNIKKGYVDVDALSKATEPPGTAFPSVSDPIFIGSSVEYLILMSDGVYKSLESLSHPPSTDTNPKLLKLIEEAELVVGDHRNVATNVLTRIEALHEEVYESNDPKSPLSIQCRKRDDMSLIVLYFGQQN